MPEKIKIETEQYVTVECDEPLPCPFCGGTPMLEQLVHTKDHRTVNPLSFWSSRRFVADIFWFSCPSCNASSGCPQKTAQAAVELWNRRKGDIDEANAHLIAAAPDLLCGLENLFAMVMGEVPRLLEDDHQYEKIVNAIAKAKGGTIVKKKGGGGYKNGKEKKP